MIDRLELWWRGWRRKLSRSEWAVALLGLPRSKESASSPGLVLIQIDGLARRHVERAIKRGRMPFLAGLIAKEHYRIDSMYSGVPSSTPAVQGELFYGVRAAVPAFSFVDRATGEVKVMLDPESAGPVEKRLAETGGEPLLKGGGAYSNIYAGGAEDSRFCSATFRWSDIFRAANPFALPVLVFSNLYSLLRIAVLIALEFGLACFDFFRGAFGGYNLWKELKFVPTRAGITILLRELVTISAKIDIARGLPVVHLNLLGYDEQAHRRGPSSAFAYWALKGVDDAIARVASAARRSSHRDYDVWIYSDHGQEETLPYPDVAGSTVHEAVARTLKEFNSRAPSERERRGVQGGRAAYLAGGRRKPRAFELRSPAAGLEADELIVTAMGPIGHVYLGTRPPAERLEAFAKSLVTEAAIPLVMISQTNGEAAAFTKQGAFTLPRDAAEILGADHPFLDETARDLAALCHHADAGDIVISGWRVGEQPISFPNENGSHAGPGSQETHAFALLPPDIRLSRGTRGFARPEDLREAALAALGRRESPETILAGRPREGRRALRIMTYNVHSCIGMDGRISPERIARVIARCDADVVALQELDVGRSRTSGVDQAEAIARALQMRFHFHPALMMEEELYGDAILSRYPMRLVRAAGLPTREGKKKLEPRGALWVEVDLDGAPVQVINTHLGLSGRERAAQIEALVGEDWLGHAECRGPVIFCGDLNALPGSAICKKLKGRLHDAQARLNGHRPRSTWFGRYPFGRIDHVFVSEEIEIAAIEVPRTELTRAASDHLPLVADLTIGGPPED